ncbi:unnamed protein product [Rotaria magnacalcarata]|uniref:Transmembrane protein n=1 Tax=Rotaria magnacalcarata TaxID=392030 RepID=A0A8S3E7X6_9BILA|nr:unnamed protein product [Rotaria magnacalcarata]CAF5183379.1 unnamed protein product [Rotaria magnacalcarata]
MKPTQWIHQYLDLQHYSDEDVIVDDENNEPNIIMELSFNNKEKMNDSGNLYISFAFLLVFSINTTCLLNLGSPFLRNISHVNSAEAFRTSNVNQSTSDLVVEEEKIHELLDKAISSTRIEVDKNVQKKNKIGNQSQRNSNDCVHRSRNQSDNNLLLMQCALPV